MVRNNILLYNYYKLRIFFVRYSTFDLKGNIEQKMSDSSKQ